MLRVLLITPDFPPTHGGIQIVAHRIAAHAERCTCKVITLDAEDAWDWDSAQRFEVHRVPLTRWRRLSIMLLDAEAFAQARRFRPDVVIAMHIVAAPAATLIRRVLGIPVITYLHAKEVLASPSLAQLAAAHSNRIVAVSSYTRHLAASVGADTGRVRVIPPGVDWCEPPRSERSPRPTIATVGRLEDRYKGHDVMVRAMPLIRSRVPGAEWVVIGDGSLRRPIKRLAAAHGVEEAVRLWGEADDRTRNRLLDRAHVFAMPSRVPTGGAGEGFGIVYLEAGVHGLPVVAGRAGGAVDAVLDGRTGLLVDPRDHIAVAEAISRMLSEREWAARLGMAGSEHARAFAWPAIARRVEDLVHETVSDP